MHVERACDALTFGVASFDHRLCYESKGCVYSHGGKAKHMTNLQRFDKDNAIVRFELNMTVGSGKLRASVDDGDSVELCNDMASFLDSEVDDSFLPFVILSRGGGVSFLGFEIPDKKADAASGDDNVGA